jgi:hypothetical protein
MRNEKDEKNHFLPKNGLYGQNVIKPFFFVVKPPTFPARDNKMAKNKNKNNLNIADYEYNAKI